jgi:hypothetical protein
MSDRCIYKEEAGEFTAGVYTTEEYPIPNIEYENESEPNPRSPSVSK